MTTNGAARLVPPISIALAVVIAVTALVRRLAESDAPVGGLRSGPVMVIASATAVLLCAAALACIISRKPGLRVAAGILAGAVLTLGVSVLGIYALDLADGFRSVQRAPELPGPTTALGLSFAGLSLLTCAIRSATSQRINTFAAAATLAIALIGLIGHAYGAGALYGLNPWGGTAVSTAVALAAIAIGVLFVDPTRGVVGLALSRSTNASWMRRLIAAAFVAPPVLGWIAVEGYRRNYIDVPFAAALLVVTLIVLLTALIIQQARATHAVDTGREELLARERDAREEVHRILESIRDAFFAVDTSWRFTYVNREAEKLLQRPRTELIGRVLWDVFSAAVGTTFQQQYERAMSQQVTARFEEYFPPLDTWFDVRAFPTPDGLSVYFSNVNARKAAETALRESEERYRLLADMIPQHIWATDPDGYHTYFSRRWYEFTGMTLESSQGEGWIDRLHPDDRERTIARWKHSLQTGEPYSIEYRFRGVDGEYAWFWGRAEPQRNENGEIVRWFGTLTDITERKQLEDERERLSESRTRLMRGFSHDVKNPLGAADGHAHLLEEGVLGELTEKQKDSVRRIRRSIATSLQLIQDLLELARAEAGLIELDCVETDVARCAREVVDDFHAQATSAGLRVSVDAPDGVRAYTDPTRMRQILANLLSNAVKYAPGSDTTVTIARAGNGGVARPGRWVAVSVRDTGPGIPADKRQHIFEEFTRLDPEAHSGAGVGLAISRRIARLMGGDLTVESEAGEGATFTLWLPSPR